jgi:hypothetical protein
VTRLGWILAVGIVAGPLIGYIGSDTTRVACRLALDGEAREQHVRHRSTRPNAPSGEPARRAVSFAREPGGTEPSGHAAYRSPRRSELLSAVARFASEEYASFEFSAHHGAVVPLARFHSFRRL